MVTPKKSTPKKRGRKPDPNTANKRMVACLMEKKLIQRLDKLSKDHDISRSRLIVKLLEEALDMIEPARAIWGDLTLSDPKAAAAAEAAFDQADAAMGDSIRRQRDLLMAIMQQHPDQLATIFQAMAQSVPKQTDLMEQLAQQMNQQESKA